MDRMRTFVIYAILLIAFFFLSRVMETGLIRQMYYNITGTIDNTLIYEGQELELDIETVEAKATRKNGYIILTVTNNTDTYISEAYVKIDLYSKSDVHAAKKYMEIKGLSEGETRTYKLKFSGSYINRYAISLSKDFPNKENIISFFGYDIDITNIFGHDLSGIINTEILKGSLGDFGRSIIRTFSITFHNMPWGEMFLFYLVYLCVL